MNGYLEAILARVIAFDEREREKLEVERLARDKALADARSYVWNAVGECQPKE